MKTDNEKQAMTLLLAAQQLQIAAHHILAGNYSYPVLSEKVLEAGTKALWESKSLLGDQASLVFMAMIGELSQTAPPVGR